MKFTPELPSGSKVKFTSASFWFQAAYSICRSQETLGDSVRVHLLSWKFNWTQQEVLRLFQLLNSLVQPSSTFSAYKFKSSSLFLWLLHWNLLYHSTYLILLFFLTFHSKHIKNYTRSYHCFNLDCILLDRISHQHLLYVEFMIYDSHQIVLSLLWFPLGNWFSVTLNFT